MDTDNSFWDLTEVRHRKVCPNAPGWGKKKAQGHTCYEWKAGNPAGQRWGAAYAPTTCTKCGSRLVDWRTWLKSQQ